MFENPRRGRQARNFGKNVPKILDLKSSSKQIFSENCRWVPLQGSDRQIDRLTGGSFDGCHSTTCFVLTNLRLEALRDDAKNGCAAD